MPPTKKNTVGKKFFGKKCFQFKCSKETCGRTWTSVHGWDREPEYCHCSENKKARVVNVKDETLELDSYNCVCGSFWQSIHGDGEDGVEGQQTCEECETLVQREENTQLRFGRHFWLRCSRRDCGAEWEDFSTAIDFFQRCTVPNCGSRGDIVRLVHRPPPWKRTRGGKAGEPRDDVDQEERNSGHLASHCDMCQILIAKGKRGCASTKMVAIKWEKGEGDAESVQILG